MESVELVLQQDKSPETHGEMEIVEEDEKMANGDGGDVTPPSEEAAEEIFVDPTTLSRFTGTALPYEISALSWDKNHLKNSQHCYCYCGKAATRFSVMLSCQTCKQLFHIECLKVKPENPPLPGDFSYNFQCAVCGTGHEKLELQGKNWTDIVRVAIWNLLQREKKKGSSRRFFQYKDEVCAFIDKHWDNLCSGKTRTKTWENTIGSSLSTKPHFFESGAERLGQAGYWGLKHDASPLVVRDPGIAKAMAASSTSSSKEPKALKKKKPLKKKRAISDISGGTEEQSQGKVRKTKLPPMPLFAARSYYDPKVHKPSQQCLSKENSAGQVKIFPDGLTASNDKGYRTVKGSWGVSEGNWYFEINCLEHSGNCRLGWATEKGDVQAPVGYDQYGYSYRDKEGTKFHKSRGTPYGEPFGSNDTIGLFISLPKQTEPEDGEEKRSDEPKKCMGSKIVFYKNGVSQGVAFSDISEGSYYAAASLYMGGTVQFNFGPKFKYTPEEESQPLCDAVNLDAVEPSDEEPKQQEGEEGVAAPLTSPPQQAEATSNPTPTAETKTAEQQPTPAAPTQPSTIPPTTTPTSTTVAPTTATTETLETATSSTTPASTDVAATPMVVEPQVTPTPMAVETAPTISHEEKPAAAATTATSAPPPPAAPSNGPTSLDPQVK